MFARTRNDTPAPYHAATVRTGMFFADAVRRLMRLMIALTFDRVLFFRLICLVLLAAVVGVASTAHGQEEPAVGNEEVAERDTTTSSQGTPYTTDRSIAYHVLATPAYVVHGATRPVGWAVKYLEERYPALFLGRLPPRGGLPLVDIGGPIRVKVGALLYDNELFGSDHSVRVDGLYGSGNAFQFSGHYQWPRPLGAGTDLDLRGNVVSNPRNKFFLGGNESDRGADRTVFMRRQVDVSASIGVHPPGDRIGGQFEMTYEHVDVDKPDQRLVDLQRSGLRPVTMLTSKISLGIGKTLGKRRTYFGTELLGQFSYSHEVGGDRFRYGRYVAELRQYVPVLFFPKSRRLLLRARVEQVDPIFGGESVPFFQQPGLGGQTSLRGFRYNRFQDMGSFLLTAEYRYPIWSNLDGVLFVDAGQVMPELETVAVDRFHVSYGGGVHLLNSRGLSARLEIAGGAEGIQSILTVEPNFRRITR